MRKRIYKNHIKKQIEKKEREKRANKKEIRNMADGDLIKAQAEAEVGDTIKCAYNFVFILSISNSFFYHQLARLTTRERETRRTATVGYTIRQRNENWLNQRLN